MDGQIDSDRILVGVDGSPSSIEALRYAARIATAFDAPLEAVTMWVYPEYSEYTMGVEWATERDATEILDQAVRTAFGASPPLGLTTTVVSGPVAGTLIDLSRTAALLVLGSRGLGGFAGLLLGSVGAACTAHAHCPVLIVRGERDGDSGDAPGKAA